MSDPLPPLPYAQWEPTKTTLHLMAQIAGKIKLEYAPFRNHWWHVTLHLTPRGFSTLRVPCGGESYFEIAFDLLDHRVAVGTNQTHEPLSFPLYDGLSVAEFYAKLVETLAAAGVPVHVWAKPYGVPIQTRFPDDTEHRSYDAVQVRRWWEIVLWSATVLERFGSDFAGKQSVPQLFWHSFDVAMTRFSGRLNPNPPTGNIVEREAYSHECISFGFWAGDANVPMPAYYTYTAPEPADLASLPLAPAQAKWQPSGNGHLGILPYDAVRESADPAAALTEFLRSGYEAGVRAADWDVRAFTTASAQPRSVRARTR